MRSANSKQNLTLEEKMKQVETRIQLLKVEQIAPRENTEEYLDIVQKELEKCHAYIAYHTNQQFIKELIAEGKLAPDELKTHGMFSTTQPSSASTSAPAPAKR